MMTDIDAYIKTLHTSWILKLSENKNDIRQLFLNFSSTNHEKIFLFLKFKNINDIDKNKLEDLQDLY